MVFIIITLPLVIFNKLLLFATGGALLGPEQWRTRQKGTAISISTLLLWARNSSYSYFPLSKLKTFRAWPKSREDWSFKSEGLAPLRALYRLFSFCQLIFSLTVPPRGDGRLITAAATNIFECCLYEVWPRHGPVTCQNCSLPFFRVLLVGDPCRD